MKANLVAILFLTSTQAFAASQLSCNISEQAGGSSTQYVLTAPLTGTGQNGEIKVAGKTLNLGLWITTYFSTLFSPGHNLIDIQIGENGTDRTNLTEGFVSNDKDSVNNSYFFDNGIVVIGCSLK